MSKEIRYTDRIQHLPPIRGYPVGSYFDSQTKSVQSVVGRLEEVTTSQVGPKPRTIKRRKLAVALEYVLMVERRRPGTPVREVGNIDVLPYPFLNTAYRKKLERDHRQFTRACSIVSPGLKLQLVRLVRIQQTAFVVRQLSWLVYAGEFVDVSSAVAGSQGDQDFCEALKPAHELACAVLSLPATAFPYEATQIHQAPDLVRVRSRPVKEVRP
jgi:hypothetical protein